jgi:hypothetical protein
MSYTNVEQVRHHLITDYPVSGQTLDQPVILAGTDYVDFYGGSILDTSIQVKSIRTNSPVAATVVLQNGQTVLSGGPVVSGSLVVASDSSLGQVYEENTDYVFNTTTGRLTVKEGGELSPDQTLAVWYLPYALCAQGADYSLDADRGRIRRLAGGSIADGETVWLDYQPVHLSIADEIVENGVAMANGLIEREVDPERQFEVDPTLSAAATYRSLEIICRAAAARELSSRAGGAVVANAWMKLADDYSGRSDLLIKSFRPPYDGPRPPRHS